MSDDPPPGRPFRMPEHIDVVPGLQETVERLQHETRFRSALDEILRVLDHDRRNPHALTLAAIVLSTSRSQQLHAEEPLTADYYKHPYFDPLACKCSNCENEWFSTHSIFSSDEMSVTNPIGVQCQQCRHTLCRGCYSKLPATRMITLAIFSDVCEKCGGKLGVPVLPTGRDPAWYPGAKVVGTVERILVFRQGPITPGREYLEFLMETFPSFFRTNTGISVYAAPHSINLVCLAQAMVHRLESEGYVGAGALERSSFIEGVDENQTKFVLAVVGGAQTDPVAPQIPPRDRRPTIVQRVADTLRGWLRG